jgi:multiple sugar transport system substrate-binding protein
VIVGELQPKEALDQAVEKVKAIMGKSGFYAGKDPVSYASMAPGMWMGKDKKLPF